MCSTTCGGGGPMSLPYSFDLPGQLKNCLRVQGVLSGFIVLGNRFSFVVPGSSRRIVWVFWIFFFLKRRVSPLLFHQPGNLCILFSRTWDVGAPSDELGLILTLLSGFPKAIGIPGLSDAIGLDAVEELVAIKEEIFIAAGRDLDTTLSSSFLILNPLRHCGAVYQAEILGTASGAEMANMILMKKIVPLITCEISFGQDVCELVFGVDVTDLDFGVKLVLSNNQSRATLWVRETCLIVGLRPTRMLCIGWNVINVCWNDVGVLHWDGVIHVWLDNCRRVSPWLSLLGPSVLFGTEWNTSITKPQRVRAGTPSMRKPASREMISASVVLCETEVCFLHIQLTGTNVRLPKMHKTPPDVDFESSSSPAKSESWNKSSLRCCAVFPTQHYCWYSLVWWMYEIKRAKRLWQDFVHFVTARASLFTDHKISGLPMRAK